MNKNILRAIGVAVLLGGAYLIAEKVMSPTTAVYNGSNGTSDGGPAALPQLPLADPDSVSKVITDTKTKQEYMSNQVIVEFTAGVSEADSISIIEGVGGKMLQRFTNAPLFLIQVKDKGDGKGAAAAIAKLNDNAQVKKAEFNYLTTLDATKTPQ